MKQYRIVTLGTNDDVFSGLLSEHNAYISTYPAVLKGQKQIKELEIGESTTAEYRLSGTKGVYNIVRVE